MPTFFNPAAGLTAGSLPYSLGGGRLGSVPSFFDAGAGLLRIGQAPFSSPAGTKLHIVGDLSGNCVQVLDGNTGLGILALRRCQGSFAAPTPLPDAANMGSLVYQSFNGADYITGASIVGGATQTWSVGAHGTALKFLVTPNGAGAAVESARLNHTGSLLLGTTSDLSNGRLQLASHTVAGGGLGFYDFSLYRDGSASARLNAALRVDGAFRAVGNAQFDGTTLHTGAATFSSPIYANADIYLGSAANPRGIYDYAGNLILRPRSGIMPTTLQDCIDVLKYHGLCS